PLMAAFFLMMTALAYQFRGWLASLMANPRRRRTVMTVVPALFFLMFQIPNLWNTVGPGARERREARDEMRRVMTKLNQDLAAGRITREEYQKRRPAPVQRDDNFESVRLVNMVAPPGWLAYGAEGA